MAKALRCPECLRPLSCAVDYEDGCKIVTLYCDNEQHRPPMTSGEQASFEEARDALELVFAEWSKSS